MAMLIADLRLIDANKKAAEMMEFINVDQKISGSRARIARWPVLRRTDGPWHSPLMEAAKVTLVPVDDYLRGELASEVRHEYVAGAVYAMAGASEEHNNLAGNLYVALRSHLRGGPCKVFMVDMKLQLTVGQENVFYYPDLLVACDERDTDRHFKRFPRVVIEVLSPETERTDRREKFMAYTGIVTVEEYVLVAQDRMEVTVFRRAAQWAAEVLRAPGEKLALRAFDFSLGLEVAYEGVKV